MRSAPWRHLYICDHRFSPDPSAGEDTLDRIDKALTLVGGSFIAAAKLVDMTPKRFRNMVNCSACLKTKWGHKKVGRPGTSLDFHIRPYDDD
jgi:hypothetical protein